MPEISQISDEIFTFRCYISAEGVDEIDKWRRVQPAAVRAKADVVLGNLATTPKKWWRRKPFAQLDVDGEGPCRGLSEVRIILLSKEDPPEETHYRILGYFGPKLKQFTLLVPFAKDDDPDYGQSCPTAQARREDVENVEYHSEECTFP